MAKSGNLPIVLVALILSLGRATILTSTCYCSLWGPQQVQQTFHRWQPLPAAGLCLPGSGLSGCDLDLAEKENIVICKLQVKLSICKK
jgi:hypothetical protein